jgi:hypothetical protein
LDRARDLVSDAGLEIETPDEFRGRRGEEVIQGTGWDWEQRFRFLVKPHELEAIE